MCLGKKGASVSTSPCVFCEQADCFKDALALLVAGHVSMWKTRKEAHWNPLRKQVSKQPQVCCAQSFFRPCVSAAFPSLCWAAASWELVWICFLFSCTTRINNPKRGCFWLCLHWNCLQCPPACAQVEKFSKNSLMLLNFAGMLSLLFPRFNDSCSLNQFFSFITEAARGLQTRSLWILLFGSEKPVPKTSRGSPAMVVHGACKIAGEAWSDRTLAGSGDIVGGLKESMLRTHCRRERPQRPHEHTTFIMKSNLKFLNNSIPRRLSKVVWRLVLSQWMIR